MAVSLSLGLFSLTLSPLTSAVCSPVSLSPAVHLVLSPLLSCHWASAAAAVFFCAVLHSNPGRLWWYQVPPSVPLVLPHFRWQCQRDALSGICTVGLEDNNYQLRLALKRFSTLVTCFCFQTESCGKVTLQEAKWQMALLSQEVPATAQSAPAGAASQGGRFRKSTVTIPAISMPPGVGTAPLCASVQPKMSRLGPEWLEGAQ